MLRHMASIVTQESVCTGASTHVGMMGSMHASFYELLLIASSIDLVV